MIDLDDLVEHWTVLDDERTLVAGKRGATRLGFALLLKFYTRHGRFPAAGADVPGAVVEFVARQVQVAAAEFGSYEWAGRSIEHHRERTTRSIRPAVGGSIRSLRQRASSSSRTRSGRRSICVTCSASHAVNCSASATVHSRKPR